MNKNLLFLFILTPFLLTAQNLKESKIDIDFEYRPRTEFRKGYRSLPSEEDNFAFFTSHRARINVNYTLDNFLLHTSLQDIRLWGDTNTRSADGKAQFYEFYVEPKINKNLSVRIGRQKIKYDNQRLFAENNWRQAGGQHDAVRVIFKNKKLESDVLFAFNQNSERLFDITYDIEWEFYRSFAAHFLKYKATPGLTFTTINFVDEYIEPNSETVYGHFKFTNGGRITYKTKQFLFNIAAYYQWGHLENFKKHNAYYIEPEIKWNGINRYNVTVGAQFFSGDNNSNDLKSTAFLAQYGAFHGHNGQMDYTAATVATYEHEGIFNPYIKQNFNINNKLSLNWQSHLLGTTTNQQHNTPKIDIQTYAWENDFKVKYKANSYTKIEMAYMVIKANENILSLDTGINGNITQLGHFVYVSATWTPKLY